MTDLGADFSGKLGPLPVWGWGALAAGVGLVGYLYYKRRTPASTANSSTTSQTFDPTSGYQTAGMQADQSQSVTSSSDIVSWITKAAQAVSGQAGTSASDAIATLTTWYQGGNLSTAQQSVVDQAIKLEGQPPVLPLSVSPITPNTPSAPTYQDRALADLNAVFGGNFTDQTATLVDKSSSKQTAINTWAKALAGGESDAQAQAQMASGPTYQAYHSQMVGH